MPGKPSQPKEWEETMTPEEVSFCKREISNEMYRKYYDEDHKEWFLVYGGCTGNCRAARLWKSSQVRRFRKLRSCCGSKEWVVTRWSWKKFRFDKYLLGFNYGH